MITRRSAVKTAIWSAPVVAVATQAPAYATSGNTDCVPTCYKLPGRGHNTKDFVIYFACSEKIASVVAQDLNPFEGPDDIWTSKDNKNSSTPHDVLVTYESGRTEWFLGLKFLPN